MSKLTYFLFGFILLWGVAIMLTAGEYRNASLEASSLQGLLNRVRTPAGTPTPSTPLYRPAEDYEDAVVRAVELAAPAVISLIITKDLPVIENCRFDPFIGLPEEFRDFFGSFSAGGGSSFGGEFEQQCEKGTVRKEIGGGSGFIVSEDGLVLTNKHVVADAKAEYTVLLNDGKRYGARVLARDPVQDLAVVQILLPEGKLPVLRLGDSQSMKLGQTAIVIGNALGEFRNTVSVGIISGLARTITAEGGGTTETLAGLIQTDAAINPGNSGGPLLNLRGEVIGINTAVAQGAENIGFAIPINKAKRDIESVKRSGTITVPYLGVRYIALDEDIAKREKLSVTEGALVRGNESGSAVISDSPAARAGILAEDIILKVNNDRISPEHSLGSLIQNYNAGDAVRLTVFREGKEMVLEVVLGNRP